VPGTQELCHIGVNLAEILELYVRRISNDRIESAAREYLGERLFPIESIERSFSTSP
jgi:hypothetical protein